MEILDFEENLTMHFKQLNYEWLSEYFSLEPHDLLVLDNPESEIIDKGGYIYFARVGEEIVGTVALIKKEEHIYELSKMVVTRKYRGRGIGEELLLKCLEKARQLKLHKVILYSNTKLDVALGLYVKHGFKEVPVEENNPYSRTNIKMELVLRC